MNKEIQVNNSYYQIFSELVLRFIIIYTKMNKSNIYIYVQAKNIENIIF